MLFGKTLGDDCMTSTLISRAAEYLKNQEGIILSVEISEVDILSSPGVRNLPKIIQAHVSDID